MKRTNKQHFRGEWINKKLYGAENLPKLTFSWLMFTLLLLQRARQSFQTISTVVKRSQEVSTRKSFFIDLFSPKIDFHSTKLFTSTEIINASSFSLNIFFTCACSTFPPSRCIYFPLYCLHRKSINSSTTFQSTFLAFNPKMLWLQF